MFPFPYRQSASQLIRSWFTSAERRPIRTATRPRSPVSFEQLEERVTPSASIVSLTNGTIGVAQTNAWMAQLPDSIPLTDISLPGTDKSGAAAVPAMDNAFFGNGASGVVGPVGASTYAAFGAHLAAATADGVAAGFGGTNVLADTAAGALNTTALGLDASAGISNTASGLQVAADVAALAANIANGVTATSGGLNPVTDGISAAANLAAAAADSATANQFQTYLNGLTQNTSGNNPNNSAMQATLKTLAKAEFGTHTAAATLESLAFTADTALTTAVGLAASADAAAVAADATAAALDAFALAQGGLDPVADAAAAAADATAASLDAAAADADATAAGLVAPAEAANVAVAGACVTDSAADVSFSAAVQSVSAIESLAQTQGLGIADQLNAGIRSLDIRGTLVNDTININNGQFYTGVTLQDVLNDCTAFLQANRSETIVMSLRSDENPQGALNSSNSFNTDLNNLLNSPDMAVLGNETYNNFIYYSSSPTTTPDLGQVRGKIVIIPYSAQWQPAPAQSGQVLGWQPTEVDDDVFTVSDPATRWNDAESLTPQTPSAGFIPTDLGNPSTLYRNNISAVGADVNGISDFSLVGLDNFASGLPSNSTPFDVAASVNPIAEQCFGSFSFTRTTGIVGMDNPDPNLIDEIIDENNLPIVVTSDSDAAGATGTLRAAINQANSQAGVNTIEFAANLTGSTGGQTILLQSDLPSITSDVDIAGSIFIEANHHQVFQNSSQRTVTEVDFVASDAPSVVQQNSTNSVPVFVNISGLTIFDHMAFVTPARTLTAGTVSKAITLELQSANNTPVLVATGAPALVIGLMTNSTSKNAKFLDAADINTVTSVSFTAGNSSVSFLYYDEKRATPTVTVTVGTVVLVTQMETVKANVPVTILLTRQPISALANVPILAAVQLMDAYGNLVPDISVTLTPNPVRVPAIATGSKPEVSPPNAVTDTNGLASFSKSSINLPGTYTVTASLTVKGKVLKVTSQQITISANPSTPTRKVR